jgi:enterochelin esterase-like enzyme
MMQLSRPSLLLILVIVCTAVLVACDPLAPDPDAVVIVVTPTDTPLPTLRVQPTLSFTPSLTLTPTRTPTLQFTHTPSRTPSHTPTITLTPSLTLTRLPCSATEGQSINLTMRSQIARSTVRYRVYVPPCYSDSGKRFPFVILMHGSDRDETQWTDYLAVDKKLESGLALGTLPPMILVMPYGGALANSNGEFGLRPTWENVVLEELLPEVERNFCTWNTREGRAIGGISRGGFWAFVIGLRNPERFGAIGGHSAFFDEDHIAKRYAAQFNPLFFVETLTIPTRLRPRLYLDVGADDYARTPVESFKARLDEQQIDADFVLNPTGEHTTEYWAEHVTDYLSFYGQRWPRNPAELPSCLS